MSIKIEDAVKLRRLGMSEEEFKNKVVEKSGDRFDQIFRLVFGYVEQPDGTSKLMSRLPNNKLVFLDKSEKIENVKPGQPYLCLVYEREREAFAKVLSEEYEPRIFIQPNGLITLVWRKDNGEVERRIMVEKTYPERLVAAIKYCDDVLKTPDVRITFRKHERNITRKKI